MKHAIWMLVVSAVLAQGGAALAQVICSDSVYVVVEGSQITVIHLGAFYNCCPEFEYSVDLQGECIIVHEIETYQGCWCVCCMDLSVEIKDVAPQEYTLEFNWFDYETVKWQVWILTVVVPDVGQGSGELSIAGFDRSSCYGTTAVAEEESPVATWSSVKALYR